MASRNAESDMLIFAGVWDSRSCKQRVRLRKGISVLSQDCFLIRFDYAGSCNLFASGLQHGTHTHTQSKQANVRKKHPGGALR